MKTFLPPVTTDTQKWYIIDMSGVILGKAATKIADILRGKHTPKYTPHIDCGDYVIVINAEKVKLTGSKMADKEYVHHSRYPNGLKTTTPEKLIQGDKADRVIYKAVAGMIPRNRMKKVILRKLKVFIGEEHPHAAQNPETITL